MPSQTTDATGVLQITIVFVGALGVAVLLLYAAGRLSGPALTGIATLGLVLVTLINVLLNQQLLAETYEARRQRDRPELQVTAEADGLRLKNVGVGPARSVDAAIELYDNPDATGDPTAIKTVERAFLPQNEAVPIPGEPFNMVVNPETDISKEADIAVLDATYETVYDEAVCPTKQYEMTTLVREAARSVDDSERLIQTLQGIQNTLSTLRENKSASDSSTASPSDGEEPDEN